MHYTHLKYEERVELAELYSEGKSMNEIALIMERSKFSRELKRNRTHGNYWPDSADFKDKYRRCRGNKINDSTDLRIFIIQKLIKKRWSPEQNSRLAKSQ